MLFPDRLRAARESRGLGQREFARICGLSANQMNRYENGLSDPSTPILITIATELGVTTDYLLGLSHEPRGYAVDSLHKDEREVLAAYADGDSNAMTLLMAERLQKLAKSSPSESASKRESPNDAAS